MLTFVQLTMLGFGLIAYLMLGRWLLRGSKRRTG